MNYALEVKNLSYNLDNKELFSNINFSIKQNEKLAILAPNGKGKSTMLKILAGLKEKTTGEIWLFGEEMKKLNDFKKHRSSIGFLFQDSNMQFICIDVLSDVCFSLLANELMNEKEAKDKARCMLDKLGILHLENKICLNLSGGEKRLVALAGILVMQPSIMFLDEPTAGLDKNASKILVEMLNNINVTILMTSHERNFISQLTDNIYSF